MSSKVKSSADRGDGTVMVPRLRFPEFQEAAAWETAPGDELFQQVNNREAPPGLPILAITQEHGAIPRHMIDYHVSVTDKSLGTYKEVRPGDFIISLRSFQGGIEFSDYHGICSPAYVILRKRGRLSDTFYRQHFKSHDFIQQLTRNLEGLRDGKMISYKQFSELQLLKPTLPEQQKIADCLDSADALIDAQGRKVEALKAHKKGLMQQLFPQEGETQPRLRFPNFGDKWMGQNLEELCESISSGKDKAAPDGGFDLYGSTGVIGKTSNQSYSGVYLLVARVGANAGLLTKAIGDFGVTDNTLVIALKLKQNIDFIFYYLDQIDLNKMIFGSGQPLITGGQLKALTIQIPKEKEQQRIAECLNSLDDLIAAETRKLDMLKAHKKALMQQLFPQVGED